MKLKLQPSQTELLFRSVDDCFFEGSNTVAAWMTAFLPCGRWLLVGDIKKEGGQLPGRMLTSSLKKGGDLLSRIAVQYHRRARA